ncbi:MAG: ATP-binding protein, partial [Clostridiales bacterium]|nr:ATP-binding protein [Clostridiales bacterium]
MSIDEIKSINEATTFEDIAEIRKRGYLACKANGFNFQSLLTDLYKEPEHFIYELIQNAEDALASEVKIKLYTDRLVFSHNGTRLFDINDIRSITGIGDTTKKPEDNKIGRFGIGFKSVFGVCESPRVYSGKYAFEINNLYVPREINKEKEFEKGTHFVLPFSSADRSSQDIYLLLHKAIEALSSDTVLFLRNISEISWETPNIKGFYLKSKKAKTCGAHKFYECEILNGAESDSKS